jgi:hypothetical protein
MAEDFDVNVDSGSTDSMDVSTGSDLTVSESTDIAVEPIADINVEELSMDSLNETELPISEPELAELQDEAAALEIQPLDEVVGPGFNTDEVMAEQETTEQPYEPSTLENAAAAAMSNADSPSLGARIIGGLAGDPASNGYAAQLAQMGIDAALPAAEGFMEAAIRQHGESPAVALENMQINQAIEDGARAAGSVGIELADNEPVYDENGADLTDEKLSG